MKKKQKPEQTNNLSLIHISEPTRPSKSSRMPSSAWVLEGYIFLEICPFHLGFHISCILFFIVISYNPLYFCGVSCNLSSFICNFVYLGLLFFLISLLKSLLVLFIFSKNKLLCSLILRIVLLVSMSFNSALILVISFLLLALGCLCCSSSTSCRHMVRLFVWNVSIFLR